MNFQGANFECLTKYLTAHAGSSGKLSPQFILNGLNLAFKAFLSACPVIDLDTCADPIAIRTHCFKTRCNYGHHL